MAKGTDSGLRIAFFVATFPSISETFVINQVADLMDRGVRVDIFAFSHGNDSHISARYLTYKMSDHTHYLRSPVLNWGLCGRGLRTLRRLMMHPFAVMRVLTYCCRIRSLRPVVVCLPFIGRQFDLVHCHFGDLGNSFLTIKDVLHLRMPIITTFYGYDASKVFRQSPATVYDRLRRECSLFFVMSNDMKQRLLTRGFPEEKLKVLPVSIDVDSYPFSERTCLREVPIEMISVARLVEKKGLDDLLTALALVKQRTERKFHCSIIGAGQLEQQLRRLRSFLSLEDAVDFKGSMKVEDIVQLLPRMHMMIQPSKMASDGDME